MTAAPIRAVTCRPWVNASRAPATSAAPTGSGSAVPRPLLTAPLRPGLVLTQPARCTRWWPPTAIVAASETRQLATAAASREPAPSPLTRWRRLRQRRRHRRCASQPAGPGAQGARLRNVERPARGPSQPHALHDVLGPRARIHHRRVPRRRRRLISALDGDVDAGSPVAMRPGRGDRGRMTMARLHRVARSGPVRTERSGVALFAVPWFSRQLIPLRTAGQPPTPTCAIARATRARCPRSGGVPT